MRLLLDTHVWLWAGTPNSRLPAQVRSVLEDPSNELWLSAISIWELVLLHESGRFGENDPAWLARMLQGGDFFEAPLTFAVAREVGALGWAHKDPADRFLVATARVLGLVLVTADERIIDSRLVPVMDAR